MKKIICLLSLIIVCSLHSQPYFQKVTTGIIATDLSSSTMSAWGDYNNDGFLDLGVIPWNDNCWSCRSPILFYKNNGNETFSIGQSVLIDVALSCNGIAWGDYNNDNRLDVIISRYFNQPNLLFRNDSVEFSQILSGSIATDLASGAACSWADYDRDGYLDIFISHGQNQNNALYHNNGNGTFSGVTTGVIVNDGGESRGCTWGDYDNDGLPDLFVANYGMQRNFLYHNEGNGVFTKITNQPPVMINRYGESGAWADYDNDGLLDLFVTVAGDTNRLYHNDGNGNFSLTNLLPSKEWGWSYYPCWADIDNDGWIDLFVPKRNENGFTSNNVIYKNNGGTSFTKLSGEIVSQEGGYSDAGSFGDFNNDGKVDLFVANGSTGGLTHNFFYKNITSNNNNFITLKIRGCSDNVSAIGTKIKVVAGTLKQYREISGGNGSQSMLWQHFGLAGNNSIDSIIIKYTNGNIKILTNVSVNQIITVTDCPLGIINNQLPVKYELKQNFPNPFNPETNIEYSLLKPGSVNLKVFDIEGRLVKNLVDEYHPSGTFKIQFNGTDLASGIYIYKLTANNFSSVKKMVLVK